METENIPANNDCYEYINLYAIVEYLLSGQEEARNFGFIACDGIFRYSYFAPNSDYLLGIFKDDGAVLSINAGDFQVGYLYKIVVTEAGTTQTLNLTPTFAVTEAVTW